MKKDGICGVAFRPFRLMLRLARVPKCSAKSGSSDDENTLLTTIKVTYTRSTCRTFAWDTVVHSTGVPNPASLRHPLTNTFKNEV